MPNRATGVLVIGVGGNVSQGILKALLASYDPRKIHAACISTTAAGLYWGTPSTVCPPAADPSFDDWLLEYCRRHEIGAVFSGVEPVIARLSQLRERLEKETGAAAVVSDERALSIAGDKLQTAIWLAEIGLPAPATALRSDEAAVREVVAKVGYPLIVKPAAGKGSAGIRRILSDDQLHDESPEAFVVQEAIGEPDDWEYTVASYRTRDGEIAGTAGMRRKLAFGTSVYVEMFEDEPLAEQMTTLMRELRPLGPCNAQFRKRGDEYVCFEINLRYSGTTPIRAHFGFDDVSAAIAEYVMDAPVKLGPARGGAAIRYWNETYVEDGGLLSDQTPATTLPSDS